jgi:hypothetical protein
MIRGCKKFEAMVYNNNKRVTREEKVAASKHALNCDTPECKAVIQAIKNANTVEDLKQLSGEMPKPKTMFEVD